MMGRKGPRDKAHHAVTVSISSARARLRRWLVVPAALAGVLPAVLLGAPPARAAGGCDLHYWWTPFDSTSSWVDAVISSGAPLSCGTSPAIARFNGGTLIGAAPTSPYGFRTLRNPDGSPYWEWGGVWASASEGMVGPPSMTAYSNGVESAETAGNGVYGEDLYSQTIPNGYPGIGQGSQVSTGLRLEPWAPGIARSSGGTVLAATGIDCSLWFYWSSDGSPGWSPEQVAGTWKAVDAPSVTVGDGGVQISAIGPGGSLWFYWAADGTPTWHPEQVAGPGSAAGGQAMTHSGGAIQIAAAAPDGSLWFYWAADGTPTWHAEEVAGPGSVSGTPAMTSAGGSMEIAATSADGSLWFYWAYDGTASWHPQLLSGPGTTFASPAMTTSSGTYEIASLTQ